MDNYIIYLSIFCFCFSMITVMLFGAYNFITRKKCRELCRIFCEKFGELPYYPDAASYLYPGWSEPERYFFYIILAHKKGYRFAMKIEDEHYDFVRSLPGEKTRFILIQFMIINAGVVSFIIMLCMQFIIFLRGQSLEQLLEQL